MTVQQAVENAIRVLIDEVIRNSQNAGQEASGRTYENIIGKVFAEGSTVKGEVWAPSYFYTLIRGRGPGAIPADFADIIKEWASFKGITFATEAELNRFANAVAWTIRREGTELYRNHLYVDLIDSAAEAFDRELSRMLAGIMDIEITKAFNAEGSQAHGFII